MHASSKKRDVSVFSLVQLQAEIARCTKPRIDRCSTQTSSSSYSLSTQSIHAGREQHGTATPGTRDRRNGTEPTSKRSLYRRSRRRRRRRDANPFLFKSFLSVFKEYI